MALEVTEQESVSPGGCLIVARRRHSELSGVRRCDGGRGGPGAGRLSLSVAQAVTEEPGQAGVQKVMGAGICVLALPTLGFVRKPTLKVKKRSASVGVRGWTRGAVGGVR